MNSTEKWRAYFSPVGRIRMLAGHPALDMANTLHWRDGELLDFVASYSSLVDWAEVAGLLTQAEKTALLERASGQGENSNGIHRQWLQLRAALKAWLPSIDGQDQALWRGAIKHRETEALSEIIATVAGAAPLGVYYGLGVPADADGSLALPLLRSATAIWNLMTFPPRGFVRQCEADSCGGYFVDQSRARPRRWCSMDSCGNRAKALRFRQHAGQAAD